jgi:hypothetical protein
MDDADRKVLIGLKAFGKDHDELVRAIDEAVVLICEYEHDRDWAIALGRLFSAIKQKQARYRLLCELISLFPLDSVSEAPV